MHLQPWIPELESCPSRCQGLRLLLDRSHIPMMSKCGPGVATKEKHMAYPEVILSDPAITPFNARMRGLGYMPKMEGACIAHAGRCGCRKWDLMPFTKDGKDFNLCPVCDASHQ